MSNIPPPPDDQSSSNYPRESYLGGPRTPGGSIDFAVIGEAFEIFKRNWQPFVICAVLLVAIYGVSFFASFMIQSSVLFTDNAAVGIVARLVGNVISGAILWILAVFALAGFFNLALKSAQGQTIDVNDAFVALKAPLPFLLAGLLVGVLTSLGIFAFYIGTFIVGGLVMFTYPFMLVDRLAPVDALKMSFETLKPHWLMAAIFYLVTSIIGGIGILACGLGLLVTLPLAYIAQALVFRDLVLRPREGYLGMAAPTPPTP